MDIISHFKNGPTFHRSYRENNFTEESPETGALLEEFEHPMQKPDGKILRKESKTFHHLVSDNPMKLKIKENMLILFCKIF